MHLFGLSFNWRNNNTASQALLIDGHVAYSDFDRLGFLSNSSNANFAAVRMRQRLDDDRNTGNFNNRFNSPWHRKLSGADPNTTQTIFDLQGAQNDTVFRDGRLSSFSKGSILIRNQNNSLLSGISNAVSAIGTAFETAGDANTAGIEWRLEGGATGGISGGGATNCRFEGAFYAFKTSGLNTTPSQQFAIGASNTFISSLLGIVNGDQNHFTHEYNSVTPALQGFRRYWNGAAAFMRNIYSGTDAVLKLFGRTASQGGTLTLVAADETTVAGRFSLRSGSAGMEIDSPGQLQVRVANLKGISASSTHANNFRSTVTLPASTTSVAVTFSNGAEPDASYSIFLDLPFNTDAWVTSKTTTGFTINVATSSGSAQTIGWILAR